MSVAASTTKPSLVPHGPEEKTATANAAAVSPHGLTSQDPIVALFNATIAAANGNGGGKGPTNTVLVLVALVALLAGWSARQALMGETMSSLMTRIEAMEKRQRRLGQAQTEALYLLTDSQRWNADTTRWLAQHLVPGAEPPPPPDHGIRVREIQRLLGQPEVSDP